MSESKKTIVITGGNSGIGYATAQRFIQEGAEVIITGRSAERVHQAAQELGATGYVADVTDLAALDQLKVDIEANHGTIDTLFINAGVFKGSPIEAIDEAHYTEVMDINFKGAVFTFQKLLPLIQEGGSVIQLSSVNAYSGMPMASLYSASKAAMNTFTRTAAIELAPRKIRVNSVNPGPVETPIFGKTGMEQEQLEGFAAAIQQSVPLSRFGQPQDIANLVYFLASDEASFITGSELNVDGGISVNTLM